MDGSAAEFLSVENLSETLAQIKITAFASPGIYTLILLARDKNEKNSIVEASQIVHVNVIVKVNILFFTFLIC